VDAGMPSWTLEIVAVSREPATPTGARRRFSIQKRREPRAPIKQIAAGQSREPGTKTETPPRRGRSCRALRVERG